MAAFGDLLVELLRERKLSIPAFAEQVHAHRSFVGYVARGERRPPLDAIAAWATALGLTGHKREEFVLAAALEHTPEVVRQRLAELERRVKVR